MKKKKLSLNGLTNLEAEKLSKKNAAELEEELEATGQDSEPEAARWVKEKGKESDKETERVISDTLTTLEDKNRFKIADYWRALADIMSKAAVGEEFPRGWSSHTFIEDKGLVFVLYSPDKRKFARAFKPSHIPEFDFQAVEKFMESAWVAINNWKEEQTMRVSIDERKS